MSKVKDLVQYCKPLLRALHGEFGELGLNASVLDVIDIAVSSCRWPHRPDSKGDEPVRIMYPHHRGSTHSSYSECPCRNAEDVRDKLMQELKEETAKQLG